MNKSDIDVLYNKLKNYSNDDLNKLTLDIIQNNDLSLKNSFSKKYNSNEIVNEINKINFKLYGGDDLLLKDGIDEAADLRVELGAARSRIDTLVEENNMLRQAGNDRKNILRLRQIQAKEKADLARLITEKKKKN